MQILLRKFALRSFFFAMLYFLVAFSYYVLYGFRLIWLIPVLYLGLLFFVPRIKFRVSLDLYIFSIIFIQIGLSSLVSFSSNILSLTVFALLAYGPLLVLPAMNSDKMSHSVLKLYLLGVVLCAVGVILQRTLFELTGMEFGKIDHYGGGRTAFGFVWADYSYLSLYLTSAIPLLFLMRFGYLMRSVLGLLLVVASATTTARTGLAALFVALAIYLLIGLIIGFSTGRIKSKLLTLLLVSTILLLVSAISYLWYSTRGLTFSGSGRLDGYFSAVRFWRDNPVFGGLFDDMAYRVEVGVIPHNVFLYIAVMGGVLALVLFLAWVVTLVFNLKSNSLEIKLALFICFVGVQFVPSVFSAYFIGALLGIALIERYECLNSSRAARCKVQA